VVVTVLLVVTLMHRPCRDVVAMNVARVVVYLLSIWSLIASLLASSLSTSERQTNYFPTIFLFSGWFVILLSAILVYRYRPVVGVGASAGASSACSKCSQCSCSHVFWAWLSDVETLPCEYCARRVQSPHLTAHQTIGIGTDSCVVLQRYGPFFLQPLDESEFVDAAAIRRLIARPAFDGPQLAARQLTAGVNANTNVKTEAEVLLAPLPPSASVEVRTPFNKDGAANSAPIVATAPTPSTASVASASSKA